MDNNYTDVESLIFAAQELIAQDICGENGHPIGPDGSCICGKEEN